MSIGEQLAKVALEIGAIKLQPTEPFTWASGYQMPIYNDNRMLLGSFENRALVAQGFCEIIKQNEIEPEVIAGTATAGIPHAAILATVLMLPMIYVRDKAKGHGLKNQIEGVLHEGQHAIMIEDLVSTGGSSIRAIDAVREAGGRLEHCFSIFSYGLDKAEQMFSEANCKLTSLLTYDVLLSVAKANGYISEEDQALLESWRTDPFGWGEAHGFPPVKKD